MFASIIWYVTWPVLIYVSYRIILYSVRKYAAGTGKEE